MRLLESLTVLMLGLAPGECAEADPPPNVVFVLDDDLEPDLADAAELVDQSLDCTAPSDMLEHRRVHRSGDSAQALEHVVGLAGQLGDELARYLLALLAFTHRQAQAPDQQHQLLEGPTTNNNIVFLMFDTAAPLFFCSRLQLHGDVIKIDKVETVTLVKYLIANLE